MKIAKIILLYLLVVFYLFMGLNHLIKPEQYYAMIPSWLPLHSLIIILSGIVEITLAILLIPKRTRTLSAKLIIAMLIVFLFTIHIPQSIDFFKTRNQNFVASVFRLPVQLLFIMWVWIFTKSNNQ